MINLSVNISLPQLWQAQQFVKNDWNAINLIVGPNGTGKSLFADQLKQQLVNAGLRVRLLNAERLAGLEKQDYHGFSGGSQFNSGFNIGQFEAIKGNGDAYGLSSSAFVLLKERLDIRIKIEALLSDVFKKNIRLAEEGGFLRPKIQAVAGGSEYNLKEQESHGLKEILTLLTFLYDDTKNCLIFDEPELHLHPQIQSFLLGEMRKMAGNPLVDPTKKLFFIITHSPYFLDIRSLDDLRNVLVCHAGVPPDYVRQLDGQDEYILRKFLPRFNTHHKQFFFSPNPVFVEGYTDQQLITLLFERLGHNISASGSSIIDVGGKDELAVFFRLCRQLKVQARILADLDAMFRGKLREVVQSDVAATTYVRTHGFGMDVASLIGELERKLHEVAEALVASSGAASPEAAALKVYLTPLLPVADKRPEVIESTLLTVVRYEAQLKAALPPDKQDLVPYVAARFAMLLEAFKASGVYIFPKGELEHYYTQTSINYLSFNDKEKNAAFHAERDHLLATTDEAALRRNFADLLTVLTEAVPQVTVELARHLQFQLVEWIQLVQAAVAKGDVTTADHLRTNGKINYALFSQLLELQSLDIDPDRKFRCLVQLQPAVSPSRQQVTFTEKTTPHEFVLPAV